MRMGSGLGGSPRVPMTHSHVRAQPREQPEGHEAPAGIQDEVRAGCSMCRRAVLVTLLLSLLEYYARMSALRRLQERMRWLLLCLSGSPSAEHQKAEVED